MGDVTLWVEENETQSVWNMLSAMVILGVPVKVKPALVIDADEETAQLVRKCLEASGLRLLVDQDLLLADEDLISQHEALSRLAEAGAMDQHAALKRLEDVIQAAAGEVERAADEIAAKVLAEKPEAAVGYQPSVISKEDARAMWHVDWAEGTDQTVVAGVERSEDINGVVTYQPVDFEKQPVGDPVIVVLEKESAPVCAICGGAMYGRRKNAKVCSSEACQEAFARNYAREYYQKNNSKKAKKQEGGEVKQVQPKAVSTETAEKAKADVAHAFPWKILDGERAGDSVTWRVLGSLVDRKKSKVGMRAEHVEKGLFVVANGAEGYGLVPVVSHE